MAKSAHRLTILYFFTCFLLLAVVSPAYAGGSRDPDLLAADSLIDNKKYEDAIVILVDYSRRHPDRFDHAQKRLRRIALIRDEFDRTADRMIEILLNDPENSEEIYELTQKLLSLEDEDSTILASFITRTHEIARFNVLRNRLRSILERGRDALDRGEAEEALGIYAGGMDFMREDFYSAGYGERIESAAIRETERVNSVVTNFRASGASLAAISAEMVRAINSGNLAGTAEITNRLNPAMDRFTGLNQQLVSSVNNIDVILAELRVNEPDMGDRNHLSFVSLVINGRSGESIQEGMLGALSLYWDNSISPILGAISQNADRINTTGLTAFNAGNYTNSTTTLGRTSSFTNLSPLYFEKNRTFAEGTKMQTARIFDDTITNNDIPMYTSIRSMNEASSHLIQAAAFAGRITTTANTINTSYTQWQAGTITNTAAMNNENQIRTTISGIQTDIERLIASANQIDNVISIYQDTVYLKNAVEAMENIRSSVITMGRQPALRYYTIANRDLRSSLTARQGELQRGRDLLDGQSRQTADGTTVIERYPAEASQVFTTMLTALTNDIARGNSLVTYNRNEPDIVAQDEDISESFLDSQQALYELMALRTQTIALSETARNRTAQAEAFRQEGERLFRESQAAYRAQNFELARERLERASDRFNNSLAIQESASLRQAWDSQLVSHGRAINAAENEMIIAEVRNLVTDARVAYFAGNFQQAEENLVRARSRWRITNADENQEVMYWLGIVRGAMSARSGRVIPSTAPLYPEMSQLLSEARKNYEEGIRYINTGRRSAGLAKFDEARLQTREVRLMFPVNQEAGILELRMEQYTDPAAFNASFEQRLRTAISGTRPNIRSIESFADLQNLAEINPNYPGMRGILNQAEIDMGYRPPPPDPRALARSRELTATANQILEANNTALFEVALSQINEALDLNPENTEAMRVKDRLLNRMSVPGTIVLSSEDEAEYQRAVRELQAGNNLIARAIVERLMQNPRNRNITKLVELQRRIQSVL
jgi:tetratricopeptide (TPR) repeat protein